MNPRIPADRDPDAITTDVPLRYDFDADRAAEAIRPTIAALARICDRIARKKAQRIEATDDTRAA